MTSYQRLQDSNNNDSGNEISFNRKSNRNVGMRNGMAGNARPEPNSIKFYNFTRNGFVSKVVVTEYPYLKPFSNSRMIVITEANDTTNTNLKNNNFNFIMYPSFGLPAPLMMTLEEFDNIYVDTNEEINGGTISTIPPAGGRRHSRRRRARRTSRRRRV